MHKYPRESPATRNDPPEAHIQTSDHEMFHGVFDRIYDMHIYI